ncbi:hypothetical protein [Rhizorhabdus argentea]|uniref:hypothetical protein n=1 Tax=Rhizorhabdus argentea TaxID=1387174 RepID=UPI0030EBD41F
MAGHATYVGDEAIRFHNEDGSHWTFDVRGMMTAAQHSNAVTQPIVLARRDWPRFAANADGYLEIRCICLGEEGVLTRSIVIDPGKLAQATTTITANAAYLALVPTRSYPRYPASALHRSAFGKCVVFADALAKV